MIITIPVSVGELLDKISILFIKSRYTDNSYVHTELKDLIKISKEYEVYNQIYIEKLFNVNLKLWKIEDELRTIEKSKNFGEKFIELARSVYITNDERAMIKKKINEEFNSKYKEIKLY